MEFFALREEVGACQGTEILPDELKSSLPSIEGIENELKTLPPKTNIRHPEFLKSQNRA